MTIIALLSGTGHRAVASNNNYFLPYFLCLQAVMTSTGRVFLTWWGDPNLNS